MCEFCEENKQELTEEEIDNIIVERYNNKDEKTKVFIRKALRVHGDKYDYYNTEYTKAKNKIVITCRTHGDFEQKATVHISNSAGCSKCSNYESKENSRYTKEQFIDIATKKYGNKFSYNKVVYVNNNTPIIITCQKHGDVSVYPKHFLYRSKCGCPKCSCEEAGILKRKQIDEFIDDAKKIHGDKYDYSEVNYINNKTDVVIICPIHKRFEQTPDAHLHGCGCPSCSDSIGETDTKLYLDLNNIKLEQHQHIIIHDSTIIPDFILLDLNTWIEYNGKQHYEFVKYFHSSNKLCSGRSFLDQLNRDIEVRKYCKENNITLIEIPYTLDTYEKIANFLDKVLIQHIDPNTLVDYSKLYKLENTGLNLVDLFPT